MNIHTLIILLFFITSCSESSASQEEGMDRQDPEPSSILVGTLHSLVAPDAIIMSENGKLYASNYNNSTVHEIDKDGTHKIFASNQPGAAGIAFDTLGNMYLSRYNSSDIMKMSPNGDEIEVFGSNLSGPIALEFDNSGNLYINNNLASYLTKIDSEGNQRSFGTHNLTNSSSLTFDEDDNIYLTAYESSTILKIDSRTGDTSTFTSSSVKGFGYITFANNEFYATNIQRNRIYRISKDGEVELLAGTGTAGNEDGPANYAQFNRPIGITTNLAGDTLYVADSNGIRIITNFKND